MNDFEYRQSVKQAFIKRASKTAAAKKGGRWLGSVPGRLWDVLKKGHKVRAAGNAARRQARASLTLQDPGYGRISGAARAGGYLAAGAAGTYLVSKKLRDRTGTSPGQENYPTFYV